jgi:hypothetical protein
MTRKRLKEMTSYTAGAATFATAAELSRLGYIVTITLRNTPKVDLLCSVPDGEQFKVQVKGITGQNAFWVQKDFLEGTLDPNLFLVVVLVPTEDDQHFQFFIMTHKEAQGAWRDSAFNPDGSRKAIQRGPRKGLLPKEGGEGLSWGVVKKHSNRWDKMPKTT